MLQTLEAAAFAAPSDVATFRVWADALEAEGDPLGEYLSLSFEQTAASDPTRQAHLRERLSLLRRHLDTWVGGFPLDRLSWQWGVPRTGAIPETATPEALRDLLSALHQSRLGRFVGTLTIRVTLQEQLEVLRQHLMRTPMLELKLTGAPPGLRPLRPVVRIQDLNAPRLSLRRLSAAGDSRIPAWMTALRLHDVIGADLPGLLLSHAPALSDLSLDVIGPPRRSDWEQRPVRHQRARPLEPFEPELVAHLLQLSPRTHPGLRHLGVGVRAEIDNFLEQFARGPLLQQLETLTLFDRPGRPGARLLQLEPELFAHLKALTIPDEPWVYTKGRIPGLVLANARWLDDDP